MYKKNLKLCFCLVIFLLIGCSGSSDKAPIINDQKIYLGLDDDLPVINLLNQDEFSLSGVCSGNGIVRIRLNDTTDYDTECHSDVFQVSLDLTTIDINSLKIVLSQNDTNIIVENKDLPQIDLTPLDSSPTVNDIDTPSNSESHVIDVLCEEVGQVIIFSGVGLKNSPVVFQCNNTNRNNISLDLMENIEINQNSITISGFDSSGNPNMNTTSFNLPIDTKPPVLTVNSVGDLKQGDNSSFEIEFNDQHLPSSFDYPVSFSGAINELIRCQNNPCVINHSSVSGEGPLQIAINSGAVVDNFNNSAPITNTSFDFNIAPAPDIEILFSVRGATDISVGAETSNSKNWDIDWGDGTSNNDNTSSVSEVSHIYDQPYTGNITIFLAWDSVLSGLYLNNSNIENSISDLPPSIESLSIKGTNFLSGTLGDFSDQIHNLEISDVNEITGNLSNLPSNIQLLKLNSNIGVIGYISDFPSSLKTVEIKGDGTIEGSISDFKSSLLSFELEASNSDLDGDLQDLPSNMTNFCYWRRADHITGQILSLPNQLEKLCLNGTLVSGDVSQLPSALKYLKIHSNANILGNYSALPSNLIYINIASRTINGNTDTLPPNLKDFSIDGGTIYTLNPALLPRSLVNLYVRGGSDSLFNGDFSNLPPGLKSLSIGGWGSVSGNIANLPDTLTRLSLITHTFEQDLISGSISQLPSQLKNLTLYSSRELLTGLMSELPSQLESLTLYSPGISGDFSELPNNVTNVSIAGGVNLTVNSNNWGRTNPKFSRLLIGLDDGLTTLEVDRVLEMMSFITDWQEPKLIDLDFYTNGEPSSTGEQFAEQIMDLGVTVRRNCYSCSYTQ